SAQVKDETQVMRMQQQILDKIAAIPGVQAVGTSTILPLDGGGWHDPIYAEGHEVADSQIPPLRMFKMISPGTLEAVGNRMVAGRGLTWMDLYEKRRVAMLSENLARELWGNPQAAIGKRIREGKQVPWREVVGVVADERTDGVNQK